MNWVKENKFLAGFIAVLAIGSGALGFLVLGASSAFEDAAGKYTDTANEFNRLRRLQPYPNRQHLEAFEKQKAEAAEVINTFQADLAKKEFPIEPMTPEQFQDQLKASVSAVRAKAKEKNVTLGDSKESTDKFYLGFDRYETAPPERDAAAGLGRQLKAIEWVVDQFIASQVTTLKINRIELPEEKGKGGRGGSGGGPGNAPGRGDRSDRGSQGGKPGGKPQQELVTYHPFDVVATGKQPRVAAALNTIIGDKAPQFYIPRAIHIRNQNPKGPARAAEVADPNAPKQDVTYIVGDEQIEAAIRFEIVDFADIAAK